MSKQMVYGMGSSKRIVAAVSSRAEFVRLLAAAGLYGYTDGYVASHGSETGNPAEVAITTQMPHTLFRSLDDREYTVLASLPGFAAAEVGSRFRVRLMAEAI